VPDAQQGADLHVFAGLGHDPFVGGDHHADDVDARGAGDHVLDELLVAGYVDDAQVAAAGKVQRGKAQFDGDAALLLFFETVGVGAGDGLDQAGLSVVNMSGGAENDLFHDRCAPVNGKGPWVKF
jgi:hypothetical protein